MLICIFIYISTVARAARRGCHADIILGGIGRIWSSGGQEEMMYVVRGKKEEYGVLVGRKSM